MYADDLVLITASLTELQKLVNIAITEFESIGLTVNSTKSSFIRLGRLRNNQSLSAKIGINGVHNRFL